MVEVAERRLLPEEELTDPAVAGQLGAQQFGRQRWPAGAPHGSPDDGEGASSDLFVQHVFPAEGILIGHPRTLSGIDLADRKTDYDPPPAVMMF
ncbi:hypothetical protein Apa02nite_049130 [Actinoplanes palleronii]|uniref:Uncharacterized protein n=1 Tax=Actinoplanes palleronii TaxID=113570 RepID=A0ABQ4BDZ0_9ACTN|nr:hypothetical protein Apa02nite_049130 [Actinoplanes palleronii]